ncbi:hypothetical protein FXO38_24974 [Capsicum annuum]|nr:hypothetical protein FXO38_24974 [Capsicum annuum]
MHGIRGRASPQRCIVHSLTLHFCQRLFPRLESVTRRSCGSNFTSEDKKDRGAIEESNNLPMSIRLRSTNLINLRPSVGIEVKTSISVLERSIYLYEHVNCWITIELRKTRDCFADVNCKLERNDNGSYIVRISVTSTIVVAELKRPLELLMRGKIVQCVDITSTVVKLLFFREGIKIMRTVYGEIRAYIHLDKHSLHVRIFYFSDNVDRAEQRFIDSLMALHESKQLEVHLRGGLLPPDLMKRVITTFGPDLSVLKEKSSFPTKTTGDEAHCAVCLCELEDPYRLEACTHAFCRSCLLEQCESAIKSWEGFPMCYLRSGCGEPFLLVDLKSLLSTEKLEELFRASLGAFVTVNTSTYLFFPSPDCPSAYRIAEAVMR